MVARHCVAGSPDRRRRRGNLRRDLYVSEAATLDAVKIGFAALGQQMRDLKTSVGWLVCDTKSALSGMIGDVLGPQAARALEKGKMVPINGLGSLSFYSSRALPTRAAGAVILACHPSAKLLDQLDSLREAASLIVLPWTLADVESWLAARGPEDILRKASTRAATVSNPVLARALESIYHRINISTGIGHPLDRDAVIDAFRILKNAAEPVNAREVRAWLVQQGMQASNADDIAAIAANPSKFRRNSSRGSWAADILNQWRGE